MDYDDKPLPVDSALQEGLLAWLSDRLNDPEELYRLAAIHNVFGQFGEALRLARRAVAHAESRYFAVGKIGRDQVEDYHLRKRGGTASGGALARGPYVNYDPGR